MDISKQAREYLDKEFLNDHRAKYLITAAFDAGCQSVLLRLMELHDECEYQLTGKFKTPYQLEAERKKAAKFLTEHGIERPF